MIGAASEPTPPVAPVYAGKHLIVEVWRASGIGDAERVRTAMEESARASGARILRTEMHDFGHGSGVTGVTLLAESHISVHTWPEYGYAALDIFTCGDADPYAAVPVLARAFDTDGVHVVEHKRGMGMLTPAVAHEVERAEAG